MSPSMKSAMALPVALPLKVNVPGTRYSLSIVALYHWPSPPNWMLCLPFIQFVRLLTSTPFRTKSDGASAPTAKNPSTLIN